MARGFSEWKKDGGTMAQKPALNEGGKQTGDGPRSFGAWKSQESPTTGPVYSQSSLYSQYVAAYDRYQRGLDSAATKAKADYDGAVRTNREASRITLDPMYAGYATDEVSAANMNTNQSYGKRVSDEELARLYKEWQTAEDEARQGRSAGDYWKTMRRFNNNADAVVRDFDRRISEMENNPNAQRDPSVYGSGVTGVEELKRQRDEFVSMNTQYQNAAEDYAAVQGWADKNPGTVASYKSAKASYDAAEAELQALYAKRDGAKTPDVRALGAGESSAPVNTEYDEQIAAAVRKRDQAKMIMDYAYNQRYNDLLSAEDLDVTVDKGQMAWESFKQNEQTQEMQYDENGSPLGVNEFSPYYRTNFADQNDKWTDDEKNIFYYLFATNRDAAFQYGYEVNQRYDAAEAAEKSWGTREFAQRDVGTGIVSSALSVPASLVGGLYDYMNMAAENQARGGIYESQYGGWSNWAEDTRGSIAQKLNDYGTIDSSVPVLGGKGFGDLYQLFMSMADSSVAVMAGGGVANLAFFGSAAASATRQALDRGMDAGKAVALGFASGAAEVLGETLSVEHLLKQGDIADYLRNGLLKEMLKQGAVEGSEEVLTTLLNTLADRVINGDDREFQQNVYVNMQNGMSYDEAVRKARVEWLEGLGADALGGFLSGGLMSGGRMGLQTAAAAATSYTGDTQGLFDIANLTDEGSRSRGMAEQYQQRYNDRGSISNLQAAKLEVSALDELQAKDRPVLEAQAKQRLEALGVENADKAAKAVVDRVLGTEKGAVGKALDAGVFRDSRVRIAYQEMAEQLGGEQTSANWLNDKDLMTVGQDAAVGRTLDNRLKLVKLKGSDARVQIKNAEMKDGKLAFTYEQNGQDKTVSADELEMDAYQRDAFDTLVEILGDDAAYAYNGLTARGLRSMDKYAIHQYATAFANIRNLFGVTGAKQEAALASPIRGNLTDAQVIQAYTLGRQKGERIRDSRPKSMRGTGKVTLDGGELDGMKLKAVSNPKRVQQSKLFQSVQAVAKALGIDVVMYESEADETGKLTGANGAYKDGVIYLDWNAGMSNIKDTSERMLFRTMSHELTHFIQQNSKEDYAELKAYVTKYLAETMGADFNDLVIEKEANQPGLSHDGAIDEVIADACETMLRNSQAVQDLMKEHPGLGGKICKWVMSFLRKITARDRGAEALQPVIADVQAIWDRGLRNAVESRLSEETLDDMPSAQEMAVADEASVKEAIPETVAKAIIADAKDPRRRDSKLAELYRQQQTVKNAPKTPLMLPAHQEQAPKLTAKEKAAIKRRFNKAVDELMDSYLFDGIDISREDAERMINEYAAAHDGYFSVMDEAKQKGKVKTGKQYADSMRNAMDDVVDVTNENGKTVAVADESTGNIQMSLRTYNEGGRKALRDFLDNRVKDGALTKEEASEIRKQMDSLYMVCRDFDNGKYAPFSAWSNATVVTYDGRPVFSVVKANGEYKLNLDFSLVCKKRRTLDAVFNEMIAQGILDDFDMVQESIAKINDIIRENGFETACGLCFVDSKRYRQGMIAGAFARMYNQQVRSLVKSGQKVDYFNYGGNRFIKDSGIGIDTLDDSELNWSTVDEILRKETNTTVKWKIANYLKNNPSARRLVMRGDFMSTAGFDAVKAKNPELLKLYNSKKGAGVPKAAQSDVQYLNEIIQQSAFNEKAAYEVGGVRIQSFSDYVGRLVFDYVQMVGDLAAKKLPAHSYTKEFMYALQFGLTGIKINMSLVPEIIKGGVAPGLDANGDYAWKDGQSFGSTVYDNKGKRMTAAEGFELAKRIQDAVGYSKNCGTIAVGVSDAHILKMLGDPDIRMIIPYHKSSLNHIVASMMNIDKYDDYTLCQNTREYKNGKWVNIPKSQEFNFNEALQRLGDAKAAANEYLEWCRKNGYKPKFDGTKGGSNFSTHENYYKLLEDFSCYDKDGLTNAPMGAVQMKFPTASDAFGSMSDLIEQGLDEDAMLQAKQEKAVPEIVKQIQDVLPGFEAGVRERGKKGKKTAQLSARTQNLGYHAGDLGKAEHLNIQGRYRGTGHFGTGTYFVGEEEKVTKDSHYGKRPQHAVDFTDYNLFKVRSDREGYQLHDFLRIVDGGINQAWIRPALDNQFNIVSPTGYYDLAKSKYGEDWTRGDNLLNSILEYAANNGISIKTLDEYKADEGNGLDDSDVKDYYEEYVKDTVKKEIDSVNEEYREFMDAIWNIHLIPGFTNSKLFSALTAVANYQAVTPRNARVDSYATVFMKAMGYEGVDVRGTRLDNTEYGSVIYDVKPETVQYSARTDDKSDRELLLDADEAKLSDAERAARAEYKAKVDVFRQRQQAVTTALDALDKAVEAGDAAAANKQRAKVTAAEKKMSEALAVLTEAERGPELREILRREREIQKQRTTARVRDSFDRRELRRKVDKLWKDINKWITSPTEKNNVPAPVMKQALDVLQTINMDTTKEGSERGQKLRDKLLELRSRYETLENDQDYWKAAVYDAQVAEFLRNMIETVGDTPINRMSTQQLAAVYNTLRALEFTARKALKLKLGEEERSAYEISKQLTSETRSVGKLKSGLFDMWLNAGLSPARMFNRLGGHHKGNTWMQVYDMINAGQLRQTQLQVEGSLLFEDLMEAKDYEKFIDPKNTVDIGLKDKDGNAIEITHGMLVSLYMHLMNEQNRRHIAYGGMTIPGLSDYYSGKKVKGSEKASHAGGVLWEVAEINDKLRKEKNPDVIAELEAKRDEAGLRALTYLEELESAVKDKLTDYDRQWIAASRELFDGFSKRVLNETTMEVYGIKRANVENYFPIWVDGNFLNTPFESVAKDFSLENAGFMKERVDSSKPIRLADVSDVAASQIRKVAQYAGLMPVVRNFNKIWGKTQTGYRDSLRQAVMDTYGDPGVKYIENLMADLNGARNTDNSSLGEMFNRLRGHMAQASLTLSLRTAMGQAASYPTAAAVLGWDAIHQGLANYKKVDPELILKWSPLLKYRMKGYRDPELGNIAQMNSKWDRLWKKARWATGWIQAMDGFTVGQLVWSASEAYVQIHNKALQKGTDAYYEAVAKKFNEAVELTQPNYTTMQRPDILRNPNALVKQLTMFLTQRLQNFNIMYDAAATYSQMKKDRAAGAYGVTNEDVRQAGIQTRTAFLSQIVAAGTIVAFKFIADVLLHSMNAYRDDDDELTKESVGLELLDMFLDSLAGNVIGGSEMYDVIESKVFGKTYYGIEVSGVSTVTDAIKAASDFYEAVAKGEVSLKDVDKLAKKVSVLAGIPYSNAMKIINGARWHVEDVVNGEFMSMEAGVDRSTTQQAHRLWRAYTAMDYGQVGKIREEVGDDDKLNQALTAYIKQQFADGKINRYEAQRQLVKYVGKDQEAAEKAMREYSAEVETGIKFSQIEDSFLLGDITASKAQQMLVKYGGLDSATAKMKVDFWAYQNKNPGSRLEFSSYKTYVSKYQGIGLSVAQYESYYERLQQCKGVDADGDGKTDSGSKKAEVLALIDSMKLTPAQKDQLYYANNYGASGLKGTPWHK